MPAPTHPRNRRAKWLILAAAPIAACLLPNAFGANLTWDSGGTAPTAAKDGDGTWSTLAAFWSNGAIDAVWDNASTAVFGNNNGTAGIVTIDDPAGSVNAAGLIFNKPGSGSYTLAALGSNTLNLSGTNPNINVGIGVSATISAPIGGSFGAGVPGAGSTTGIGLLLNGGGTLTLTSNLNTYTGSTTISYNPVDRATATRVILANGASLGNTSGDVYVGYETSTSTSTTDNSSLSMGLVPTDVGTLTANTVFVNWNIGSQTISTTSGGSLLINGNDTINANSIILDAGRGTGNTKGGFALMRMGAGATLTLNGASGPGNPVNLIEIANYSYETGGGTGTGINAIADFTLGTVIGSINTLNIATAKPGSGGSAGFANGSFLFSNGSLSISTINIARRAGSGQGAAGTFTLVSGGAGTITAGAINFRGNAGSTAASTNGVININGSTLVLTGDINADTGVSGAATAVAIINLAGGTLDMGGHALGPGGGITLNATSGTLKNVSNINSTGGVTMTGTGTLILAGNNTYTGSTTINSGTVIASGTTSMGAGAPLAVNGGTLDLSGSAQSVSQLSGTGSLGVITSSVTGTSTLTVTAGNGTYNGVITDGGAGKNVALSVTGGSTSLSGAGTHTYSGATNVSSGAALTIAHINSTTAVTNNGTLAAAGAVGAIILDGGGNLTPGAPVSSGTTGTLTGTSLTVGSGGGTLNFLANSLTSFDQLTLSGGATLNGGLTVNVTLGTGLQSGTYTLLNAAGGLTLNGNTVTSNVTVGGGGTTRISGSVSTTASQIQLLVNGSPANLVWTGANDTTTWDIKNHQNWTSTAPSDPNRFYQADSVTFDNTSSNLTINVTDAVQPSAVTFNNNATHNYTLNGTGIGGSGNLTLSGAGSVTLNNVNTYSGSTDVNAGNLMIGTTGAIGGSTLTVASGASASVNSGGTISTTAINVSGSLTAGGTVGGSTLVLASPANVNVISGGTISTSTITINGGSLTVQSGGNLASNAVTVANGATLTAQSGANFPVAPNLTDNGVVTFASDQTIGSLTGTDATAALNQTGNLTVNSGGNFAGSIKNGAGTANLTVNGGTLVLTGNNTYTGTTNINSGAAIVLDNGSNTGTLSTSTTINAGGTFIYARTDSPSFSNTLTGSGGAFRQAGGGTITLTGDNSGFSSSVQVYNGTVVQGSATSLGSNGDLVLGTPGNNTTTTPVGNLILSSAVPATSVNNISATNSSLTANPIPDVITIPAGVTLTANGVTVGSNNNTVFTTLAATGGGAININGNITVAQANNTATLDLTGLNSVTINDTTINVSNNTARQGNLLLANTTVAGVPPVNSVTTSTLNVSTPGSGNDVNGASVFSLGSGTNTIRANIINLGTVRGVGIMQFAAGAPATASVTITDQGGGGGANINLSTESGNGPAGAGTSGLLLAGHVANVQVNNLTMATASSNQNATLVAGSLTFDTGSFSVTGAVTVGAITGGGIVTNGANGQITLGGPTPNTTATGVFTTSGGITLGNFTNGVPDVVALAKVTSTFTLNGGTANIGGNIVSTSTQGTTIATVNLNSGTLNMNNNAIGGNGGVNSGNGPITVNFPASGNTATLANLGGGGINGAGILMNSAGTLQLAGTANYTGTTGVQSGKLVTLGDDARNAIFNMDGADITGGLLIFDYNTGTDPAVQVGTILTAGFNQTPTKFATGPLRTSGTDPKKGLGYNDNTTAKQLTVRYTWYGDANLDGKVNALDFNAVAKNFGQNVGSQTWGQGDFNYDAQVSTADFTAMAQNFGSVLPSAPLPVLGSLVPEPASMMLAIPMLACLRRRRRA